MLRPREGCDDKSSWTFSDKGALVQARRELGRAWTLGLDADLTERPGDFVLAVRHQDRAAEEKSFHLYRDDMILTMRDEGGWWATAGSARNSLGGDRPVLGGPWRNESDAVRAAEAFCSSGKAG